jgi:pimeloyl-ACP methyl ester carboxylesterase
LPVATSLKISNRWRRRLKLIGALLLSGFILGCVFVWNVGSVLMAPTNGPIGNPPADLPVQKVEFASASGATIHGWLATNTPGKGVIVLMHGIHATRVTMSARAEFLYHAGYTVLWFDFQGHGESIGKSITGGYLESRDAVAAVDYVRAHFPGAKIGVIGVSMGGAAALVADPPLPVDALVIESCYPTIYQAIDNRIALRLGPAGHLCTPLVTWQLKPRLGFRPADLCPIRNAALIPVPKFFISGDADVNTPAQEARDLYQAASEPKQFWLLPGAGHVDMHAFAHGGYERRVLGFFATCLR